MTPQPAALFSLEGRTALVTGAGSGLGKAMALGFAASGSRVICADIVDSAARATAGTIGDLGSALALDVRDRAGVDRAVRDVVDRFGTIDCVVNSAGIGGRGPAVDFPAEVWENVFAVNVTGTYNVCRAVGEHMIERGSGSIVNIGSIAGLVGYAGSIGYQASKGAVTQLTRTLAVEWAPLGVRVNAIAPGHIATELVRRQWETEPELKEFFLSRTPMGVLGEPGDLVGPALFLASDASRMVTGQIIAVDGGFTSQ